MQEKPHGVTPTAKILVKKEIEVELDAEKDFRKINAFLRKKSMELYTFDLRSEKPLRVVLKGLPHEIKKGQIKENLKSLKYKVQIAIKMKGRYGSLPIILVNIGKEYKPINNLKHRCGLIQIESLNRTHIQKNMQGTNA